MADRLRKARTDAGFTAQDMCDMIGISRKTVTNYEQGDTRPLRPILRAWVRDRAASARPGSSDGLSPDSSHSS